MHEESQEHPGFCHECCTRWPCDYEDMRTAVAASEARAAALSIEVAMLREALHWYADEENYEIPPVHTSKTPVSAVELDLGERAQAILVSEPGVKGAAMLAAAERMDKALLAIRFPAGDAPEEVEAQAKSAQDAYRAAMGRGE